MRIGAADKDKIESMVEYNYRTERRTFWFAGEHLMYCTQQEYDEYCASIKDKKVKIITEIVLHKDKQMKISTVEGKYRVYFYGSYTKEEMCDLLGRAYNLVALTNET